MMLQDQLITASFILGGSQQAHLQVFQNLLLVCRKLLSFCFCHPRTVKKSGAVVPQKVISSLPARGLSPQKPRPSCCGWWDAERDGRHIRLLTNLLFPSSPARGRAKRSNR